MCGGGRAPPSDGLLRGPGSWTTPVFPDLHPQKQSDHGEKLTVLERTGPSDPGDVQFAEA